MLEISHCVHPKKDGSIQFRECHKKREFPRKHLCVAYACRVATASSV